MTGLTLATDTSLVSDRAFHLKCFLSIVKEVGANLLKEENMMDWYGNGSGWMNGGGFFLMAFFFISVIGLVVWVITRNSGRK